MPDRVLLYCRQSVAEADDTLSLDSQSSVLTRWAAEQGWVIVGEVRDWNEKGHDDTRPGLLEIMARAGRRELDLVAVWSLDRLARSVRIQENTLHELTKQGVEVRSYKEDWVAQPLFRQILGAIAEEQTRTISGHVRRALSQRARCGQHHGRVPFGYRRDPDTGKLTPDPARAGLVGELFTGYAGGATLSDLVRLLLRAGAPTMLGAPWSRTSVQSILTNPVYLGHVRSGAVTAEDAHPPLIDAETWQRAQRRKANYHWSRRKPYASWLEGHIEHACGHRMYLSTCGKRSPQPHFLCGGRLGQILLTEGSRLTRAECTVHPGRVRQSYAERQAWMVIVTTLGHVLPLERVLADLTHAYAAYSPTAERERAALDARRRRAVTRQHKAEELYLSGSRDRAWFDAEDGRARADLAAIESQFAGLPAAVDRTGLGERHAHLATLAGRLDLILPADRGVLLAELGSIRIGPGRNLNPSVHLVPHERYAAFFGVPNHR